MLKEGKKEKIIGISIFVVLIVLMIIFKNAGFTTRKESVYGAVGGGKEDFLNDEEFNKILNKKYKIDFIGDGWSNGKTVREPVVRENGSDYNLILSDSSSRRGSS